METTSSYLNSTRIDPFDLITPTFYAGHLSPSEPNSWSLGLTPSIFSRLTPGPHQNSSSLDTNPFEASFNKGLTSESLKKDQIREEEVSRTTEILPHHVYGGRKRALSSPALFTPGGNGLGLPYSLSSMGLGLVEVMTSTPKRPRLFSTEEEVAAENSFNYQDGYSFDTRGEVIDQIVLDSEHSSLSSAAYTPTSTDSTANSSIDDDSTKPFTPPMFNIPLHNSYQSRAPIYDPTVFNVTPASIPVSLPTSHLQNYFHHLTQHLVSPPPLTRYQQFNFPPSSDSLPPTIESASPFSFQLQKHREILLTAANGAMAQLLPTNVPDVEILPSTSNNTKMMTSEVGNQSEVKEKVKVPGKRGKGKKNLATAISEGIILQEKLDPEDEAAKRKGFLERNRVAASKSRLKKKEKVGGMEAAAGAMAGKNHVLQKEAFALQEELSVLRQLLDTHNGCECEHVLKYLARERTGRGIPTIINLAGRVLDLDYTRCPTMGGNDDVYAGVEGLIANDREGSEGLPTELSEAQKVDGRTIAGKLKNGSSVATIGQSAKISGTSTGSNNVSSKKEVKTEVESSSATESTTTSRAASISRSRKGSSASSNFETAILESPDLGALSLPAPPPPPISPRRTFQDQYQEYVPPGSTTRSKDLNGRGRSGTSSSGNESSSISMTIMPLASFDNERQLRSRNSLLSSTESPYIERESSSMRDSYFPTL